MPGGALAIDCITRERKCVSRVSWVSYVISLQESSAKAHQRVSSFGDFWVEA